MYSNKKLLRKHFKSNCFIDSSVFLTTTTTTTTPGLWSLQLDEVWRGAGQGPGWVLVNLHVDVP